MEPTLEDFLRDRTRRFGAVNPERMASPFWEWMVRTGLNGYSGRRHFGKEADHGSPVWSFDRFGMTRTLLPDGRTLCVAGEHEDFYDSDFCIYNDAIELRPDGSIAIYGYPESVFPPTDFHSATLIGDRILLIGTLGYSHARRPGETPCYWLDTRSLRIDRAEFQGCAPSWLSRHAAWFDEGAQTITVVGGSIFTGKELVNNTTAYRLDVPQGRWATLTEQFVPRKLEIVPSEDPELENLFEPPGPFVPDTMPGQLVGWSKWCDDIHYRVRVEGFEIEIAIAVFGHLRITGDPRIAASTLYSIATDLKNRLETACKCSCEIREAGGD